MSKKTIGVEFDAVLSDTTDQVVNLYNHYTGENLTIDDITEWDFSKVVPAKYVNLIFDLFFNDKLWESIQPLKDSQLYMKLLSQQYEIFVITATYYQNAQIKMDWLFKQYPFIKKENVIITHNKQIINVDLMVDDYQGNLIGGHFSKILLDYPWNRNINDKEHGILRVKDWSEIYKGICTLLPAYK